MGHPAGVGRPGRGGLAPPRRCRLFAFTVVGLIVAGGQPLAPAEIIVDGACTLVDAIHAANSDAPAGACSAGSGHDFIRLMHDVTLDTVVDTYAGDSGLPRIETPMSIDGRGHEIARDPAAPWFRFAAVDSEQFVLENVTVSGGRSGGEGGAFYLQWDGNIPSHNTMIVLRATFSDNHADSRGGAISNHNSFLSVHGSRFESNTVVDGGATYARGGAIASWGAESELVIGTTTLAFNTVGDSDFFSGTARGGAVYNSGLAEVYDSTFVGNDATIPFGSQEFGSAIHNDDSLFLTNSTISGNGSSQLNTAAAIDNFGTMVLTNVTLSGNRIWALRNDVGGSLTLYETIVANTLFGSNCSGPITNGGNDLVDDTTCGTIPILSGLDPTLADHGGATETHALLAGSNAIDGGEDCGVPDDQRGAPRVEDCDIGAFEYMGCPVLELTGAIDTVEVFEECAVELGPNFFIDPGGDVTVRSGTVSSFFAPVQVRNGGALAVGHDPALQLLLPELIAAERARRRGAPELAPRKESRKTPE